MTRPLALDDLYRLRVPSDPQVSPDGTRLAFVMTAADEAADKSQSAVWLLTLDGDEPPVQITQGPHDGEPRWSPDGSELAFVAGGRSDAAELRVLPLSGGESRVVVTATAIGNLAWSSSGTRLAYLALAPLDDAPAHAPVVSRRLGFKADGVGLIGDRRRHVFVVDAGGGEAVQLTDGEFSVTVGPVWSPDGGRLAWAAATDADPDLEIVRSAYVSDATGGAAKRVTEAPAVVSSLAWLPDGASLLIAGMERQVVGHARLFTVAADGGPLQPVAPAFDRNVMVGGPGYPGAPPRLSGDGRRVTFCARDRGCTHVYEVDVAGGVPTKVLGDDAMSVAGLSVDGAGRLLSVASTPSSPGEIFIGTETRTSFVPDDLELVAPRGRTFTAPDGTEIHGWVLRRDDAPGPGPLLLDVHGGPHNAWNGTFDGVHLYHQLLVNEGWTIVFVNPRGSDGYGEAFYRAVAGAWGSSDTDDFLVAIDALVEDGTVDSSRVAVTGYSYGGYMTCWLTARTDRFAAAITGGCVSNLTSSSGTSDLGYFLAAFEFGGVPPGEARLVELSPLTHVDDVRTPTLILHGENDDRCDIGQAEEWFTALRVRKVETELVRYPGASHLFILLGRPSHRIDYCQRVTDWALAHTQRED